MKWQYRERIVVTQIKGKIPVPTRLIHCQCSNCAHCFTMIAKEQYKYCPNCGEKQE